MPTIASADEFGGTSFKDYVMTPITIYEKVRGLNSWLTHCLSIGSSIAAGVISISDVLVLFYNN